jgi:hypothetical protein
MTPITTASLSTEQPNLSTLPRRVDRKTAAALITLYFFPVTPRSLGEWPVTWRMVNGKAVGETPQLFAVAQAKLDAAPPIASVRRRISASAAVRRPTLAGPLPNMDVADRQRQRDDTKRNPASRPKTRPRASRAESRRLDTAGLN